MEGDSETRIHFQDSQLLLLFGVQLNGAVRSERSEALVEARVLTCARLMWPTSPNGFNRFPMVNQRGKKEVRYQQKNSKRAFRLRFSQ